MVEQDHSEPLLRDSLADLVVKPGWVDTDVRGEMQGTDSRVVGDERPDLTQMRSDQSHCRRLVRQPSDHGKRGFGCVVDIRATERFIDDGDGCRSGRRQSVRLRA